MTKTLKFCLVLLCARQTWCELNTSESLLDTTIAILTGGAVNISIGPSTETITAENKQNETIRFFLLLNNANSSTDTQELSLEEPLSIVNSDFIQQYPVKILIHGFNGDCRDLPFPAEPLREYAELKKEKTVNVICVDWEPWSRYDGIANVAPLYILIRTQYSQDIGDKVAKFIVFLRDSKLIKSLSDVHLVGQSLGAHISGATAFKVTQLTGEKVGRITGLDPAGPLYREFPDLDEQLDSSDAEFVDIYHTSMRRAGLEGKYGHVDFYPNGGVRQPSCLEGRMNRQLYESVAEVILGGCSHSIAANYWADTIRRTDVVACKAESYAQFKRIQSSRAGCTPENQVIYGENCPISARGKYFLDLDAVYTPEP